jgi:hypothetical protein
LPAAVGGSTADFKRRILIAELSQDKRGSLRSPHGGCRVESTAIWRRFYAYFTQLPTVGRAFPLRYSGRASLGLHVQVKREGRH